MLKYYYIDDTSKLQCGPFLQNELVRKNIQPQTMVWRSGMEDWVEAGTLQELNFIFDTKTPALKEQKEHENKPPQFQPQKNNNQNTATYSRQEQYQRGMGEIIPIPKNWLIESILLTIFCCSPISLVGIIYAVRVEVLYGKKEYKAAQEASDKAKMWALCGIAFLPVVFILFRFFLSFFYKQLL